MSTAIASGSLRSAPAPIVAEKVSACALAGPAGTVTEIAITVSPHARADETLFKRHFPYQRSAYDVSGHYDAAVPIGKACLRPLRGSIETLDRQVIGIIVTMHLIDVGELPSQRKLNTVIRTARSVGMRELAVAGKLVTTNAFLGAWRVGYCHYRDKPSRRSSSLVQTRRFQLSFVLLFLFSLTALPGQGAERVEPWDGDSDQAVRLIGDTGQSLWQRLDTVNKLAATHDASLAPKIEKLLDRVMPDILSQIDGWNAAGYERVVDFRLIGALHELGDDSENHRIAPLVAAGEEGGTEPVEEANHAAAAFSRSGASTRYGTLSVSSASRTTRRAGMPSRCWIGFASRCGRWRRIWAVWRRCSGRSASPPAG